jgi:hypothetical protein
MKKVLAIWSGIGALCFGLPATAGRMEGLSLIGELNLIAAAGGLLLLASILVLAPMLAREHHEAMNRGE